MTVKTADRARGKWRGILMTLGIEAKYLTKRHGPCPFCEGRDRFRWDDKDGKGTFICSHCGAGDGIEFLKRAKGWDFKTAVNEVDAIVGGVAVEPQRPQQTDQQRADMLNRLWKASSPIVADDAAGAYLRARDVLPARLPPCLRYAPCCPVPHGGGDVPAMLALVQATNDAPASIHRTFLADPAPGERRLRAMMPGTIPDGAAVRLCALDGPRLGIGEGIETSLAAAKRFQVPTWAALSSPFLEKWIAPPGIDEVLVFGDNDPAFGGQAAAYALAHRLAARCKLKVTVHIPAQIGRDWADADAA